MFRTVNDQLSLWEAILPPELLVLPGELARVDVLLDDPASVGADGELSTDDVLEVPLSAGFRVVVSRSGRFHFLATVLPYPFGHASAASDHADEADQPLRGGRGGWAQ